MKELKCREKKSNSQLGIKLILLLFVPIEICPLPRFHNGIQVYKRNTHSTGVDIKCTSVPDRLFINFWKTSWY